MAHVNDKRHTSPAVESADARNLRLQRERSMLAVAEADMKAGRFVAEDWLEAWERREETLNPVSSGRSQN